MTDVIPLVPASGKPMVWLWGVVAFLLILAGLLALFSLRSRSARVELGNEGFRVDLMLYGRTIPWSAIEAEGIEALDLSEDRARPRRPKWRTNGLGVPGLQLGWFRLHDGSKALVFLTDHHRVVRVPTREGYEVLLSAQHPDELAGALRSRAAR